MSTLTKQLNVCIVCMTSVVMKLYVMKLRSLKQMQNYDCDCSIFLYILLLEQ